MNPLVTPLNKMDHQLISYGTVQTIIIILLIVMMIHTLGLMVVVLFMMLIIIFMAMTVNEIHEKGCVFFSRAKLAGLWRSALLSFCSMSCSLRSAQVSAQLSASVYTSSAKVWNIFIEVIFSSWFESILHI